MFFITCVLQVFPGAMQCGGCSAEKIGKQIEMRITRAFRLAILVFVAGVVVMGSEGCRARKDCGCDINGLYRPMKKKHRY
jgi:hypothetical protein